MRAIIEEEYEEFLDHVTQGVTDLKEKPHPRRDGHSPAPRNEHEAPVLRSRKDRQEIVGAGSMLRLTASDKDAVKAISSFQE